MLDDFKHTVDIPKHVVVPDSQDAVAVRFQDLRPLGIGNGCRRVLATVDLDNEASGMACEIDDVLLDPNLPAEMGVLDREAMTQVPPELALGVGG